MKLLPLLLLSVAFLVQSGSVVAQSKSDTKKKSETVKAKKPVGKKPVAKKPTLLKNPAATMDRKAALTQYATGYSIRTAEYRYTEWGKEGSAGAELYDHKTDPAELVNLANRPDQAAIVKRLSRLLRERIAKSLRAPKGVRQIRFSNRRRVR